MVNKYLIFMLWYKSNPGKLMHYTLSGFHHGHVLSQWSSIWHLPCLLHQDAPILQNSADFVDDDLDLVQQPAVASSYGDVTFDPVVSEAGEGERAVGQHIETQTAERLENTTAERPASVWSQVSELNDFNWFIN